MLASALQTAFNLGMLPELVKTLLGDLTEAVEGRIRKTFDLASLAKEAGLKGAFLPPSSPSLYFFLPALILSMVIASTSNES